MARRHAVVFSGGGADGAYEVGVAKALFNGKSPATQQRPLDPKVLTGTSIGSFNASYLVSHWDDYGPAAIGHLETVWLERIAEINGHNGGFRIRLDPTMLLDPRRYLEDPLEPLRQLAGDTAFLGWEGTQRAVRLATGKEPFLERLLDTFNLSSLVSVEPWEQTLREVIDYKKIRQSPKKLSIAATNWVLGEVRMFGNHDMSDKLGPMAIRASSAVPGFYPPAKVGAQTYVDGAVLMNTPLKPAIKLGATVLHVIYMNTDIQKMPLNALDSTLETLYRSQVIAWAAAVNRDIKRAAAFNRGIELMEQQAKDVQPDDKDLAAFLEAAGPMAKCHNTERKYKQITIHRYFPPDGLDGALGFLNINRQRLARLIEDGFADTIAHNCEANGCILPGDSKAGG